MKKNDATVSSLDWITYSSYVDGPCWMKYVDDNKFLDELSIPVRTIRAPAAWTTTLSPNPRK